MHLSISLSLGCPYPVSGARNFSEGEIEPLEIIFVVEDTRQPGIAVHL
jgi:hypothetical protein